MRQARFSLLCVVVAAVVATILPACGSGSSGGSADKTPIVDPDPDPIPDPDPPCDKMMLHIYNSSPEVIRSLYWKPTGDTCSCPGRKGYYPPGDCCVLRENIWLSYPNVMFVGRVAAGTYDFFAKFGDCEDTVSYHCPITSFDNTTLGCEEVGVTLFLPEGFALPYYLGTTTYWTVEIYNYTNYHWDVFWWRRHEDGNLGCWQECERLEYAEMREIKYQGNGFYDLAFRHEGRNEVVFIDALPIPGTYITEGTRTVIDIGPDENEVLIEEEAIVVCEEW